MCQDIREDEQLFIKIRKCPCLFNISNTGYKTRRNGKKLMINWELKKVLPYAMKR